MGKLYLFLLAVISAKTVSAQAVLNEIYAYPSAGNHEFFELYNTSTSQDPISVDGYTLITYFEEPGKKGFYILDLPNLNVASKGYLVGSSKIPFNFQGNTNVNRSDFNWNDPMFRSGVTGGYLKKWYLSNNNLLDGNPYYDEEVLPLDFNDLFDKKTGNGASYNAFLYNDGILVHAFIGGTGGNTFIPTFITNMPVLNFINIKNGVYSNYSVNYSSYNTGVAEYVIQDIGIDNGFIRKSDGMCGAWDKSSAQNFHTPQQSNGGSQMASTGSLTIDTHISRGVNGSASFIAYNVTAGPSHLFPVDLYVYADNGSVTSQWDANDVFLEGNIETAVGDGPFTTFFTPDSQQLILVVKTALGCYDQARLVLNPNPPTVVLPVTLKQFTGKQTGGNSLLQWVVVNNNSGSSFEIERSLDGKAFSRVSITKASTKQGEEYYSYSVPTAETAYYRLKVVDIDKRYFYSRVVFLEPIAESVKVKLLYNPVADVTVDLVYQAEEGGAHTVVIYNTAGAQVLLKRIALQKGHNVLQLELEKSIQKGIYLLELINKNGKRSIERFIKQ